MTETDEIEAAHDTAQNAVNEDGVNEVEAIMADEVDSDLTEKPRRKYGKFVLGFTALSALIIGGASGGGFVRYIMPVFSPAAPAQAIAAQPIETQPVDLAPLEAQIKQLGAENAQLEAQISELETSQNKMQAFLEDVVENIESLDGQGVDAAGLASRLETLEKAPVSMPIDEALLERLEALQADGSQVLDLSAIEARLGELEGGTEISDAVEARLLALSEKQTQSDAQISDLSDELKSARADLLDAQLALTLSTETALMSETKTTDAALLKQAANTELAFPKQAMLDALAVQTQKKPLLKRALGKHIKVKDPSNPAVIIDAIETDLAQGDKDMALGRFDTLPPDIRRAGQIWRDQFK